MSRKRWGFVFFVVGVICCFALGRARAACSITCDNVSCAVGASGNIHVWTKPVINGAGVSYCYAKNFATVPPQIGGDCTVQINPATKKPFQVWQFNVMGTGQCPKNGNPQEAGSCGNGGTAATVNWYQCVKGSSL